MQNRGLNSRFFNMQSKLYAVIGNPIAHSLSPEIHQAFARQCNIKLSYEKILCPLAHFNQEVTEFFATKGQGLNVTLPFKEQAFAIAEAATKTCRKAKAANTLWIHQGKLHADNTDAIGFIRDIKRHRNIEQANILILGTGGACRGVLAGLDTASIKKITIATRNAKKAETLIEDFPYINCLTYQELDDRYDLIIHATSARLREELPLLTQNLWKKSPFAYDLNYDRTKLTPFLEQAQKNDCPGSDGLGMLVEQAAESFFIWHGLSPDTRPVLEQLRRGMTR